MALEHKFLNYLFLNDLICPYEADLLEFLRVKLLIDNAKRSVSSCSAMRQIKLTQNNCFIALSGAKIYWEPLNVIGKHLRFETFFSGALIRLKILCIVLYLDSKMCLLMNLWVC